MKNPFSAKIFRVISLFISSEFFFPENKPKTVDKSFKSTNFHWMALNLPIEVAAAQVESIKWNWISQESTECTLPASIWLLWLLASDCCCYFALNYVWCQKQNTTHWFIWVISHIKSAAVDSEIFKFKSNKLDSRKFRVAEARSQEE